MVVGLDDKDVLARGKLIRKNITGSIAAFTMGLVAIIVIVVKTLIN